MKKIRRRKSRRRTSRKRTSRRRTSRKLRSTRKRSSRRTLRRKNRSRKSKRRSRKSKKQMKGGSSNQEKRNKALLLAGLGAGGVVSAGASKMPVIPKAAAVSVATIAGSVGTAAAIKLQHKITEEKKKIAESKRADLKMGGRLSPVISPVKTIFDAVIGKLQALSEEHIGAEGFVEELKKAQGHQAFPFNVFAFIAGIHPEQMKKILERSLLLMKAFEYGSQHELTGEVLQTKETYTQWCSETLGETTGTSTEEEEHIKILKGLSTMNDEELVQWAFPYLQHYHNMGLTIPTHLESELEKYLTLAPDLEQGLKDIKDKITALEKTPQLAELEKKIKHFEDKCFLIFFFVFAVMINNFPEYENNEYQMDAAHNNVVFHKIKLVFSVLHKDVALTREYIFIHAVKGLLALDLKDQVTSSDSDILSKLSVMDDQELKTYYNENKEPCNQLITLYLKLKGKSIEHLVSEEIDYIVSEIETGVDEAGAILMNEKVE